MDTTDTVWGDYDGLALYEGDAVVVTDRLGTPLTMGKVTDVHDDGFIEVWANWPVPGSGFRECGMDFRHGFNGAQRIHSAKHNFDLVKLYAHMKPVIAIETILHFSTRTHERTIQP